MNEDRTKRKLTAIFSTDVVGYSRLMEADEAWTIQNLEENKRLISKLIEEYEGRVIDAPGDNLLAEFNSVINSVECAVKIQQELKKKNSNLIESRRMHFRIGINLGDVVEEEGRIYGNGVNIAARLEGLTDPGGICISRRTYDHIKTRLDLGYEYLGEHNVKNISEPVRVYRVLMGSENAGKVVGEKKASKMISRKLAMTTFIALIIIAAGLLFWNIYSRQSRNIEQASESEQPPAVVDVAEAPKTIALLPFENLSPDPDQEYFVDGLSEELLNSLAKIPDLSVTSRTSSFYFKGTNKKLQEIANDLGVEYVLEGSVRKEGDELRITAQLIRVKDDSHLWSETYDRKLEDIFAVQEDIATRVANELKLKLGIGSPLKQLGGTDNEKAYELYLIAKGQRNENDYGLALRSINSAVESDPKFALGWAYKGLLHWLSSINSPTNLANSEQNNGLNSVKKAIELEPEMGQAYLSLGALNMTKGYFIEAEMAYRKGIELTNQSIDYTEYSLDRYFSVVGYLKKYNEVLEKRRRNDPLNREFRSWYMFSFGLLGNMKRAEKEYESGKVLFGDHWNDGDNNMALLRIDAKEAFSSYKSFAGKYSELVWDTAKKYADSPEDVLGELRHLYADEDSLSPGDFVSISFLAALFGDPEFALVALEKGFRIEGSGLFFAWLPGMHDVRKLPQFKEFIREIGLVDYWNEFGWPDICRPLENGDFVCD